MNQEHEEFQAGGEHDERAHLRLIEQELSGEALDDVSHLNRILAELGSGEEGGAFVQVYRADGASRAQEFLDRYDAAEFADGSLLDHVREEWGAGRYQFSVYAPGGGLRARKVIKIAARKGEVTKAVGQSSDMEKLIAQMQMQNQAMMQGMSEIAKMVAAGAQKPENEDAILKRLLTMKELFGGNESRGGDNTAATLLQGVQLARDLGDMAEGGGGNGQWLDRVLEKFAMPALTMVANNAAQTAGAKPAQTVAGVPRETKALEHAATEQVVPRETEPKEDDNMVMLKMGLMMLKSSAAKGEDVQDAADRVMMMLSLEDIEQLIGLPNWFEVLCNYEPGCAAYKTWFDLLHETLVELVRLEKNPDEV